jgi:hypothetical protein
VARPDGSKMAEPFGSHKVLMLLLLLMLAMNDLRLMLF